MSDEIIQRPDPGEGEDKPEEPSGQATLTELFASWVSRSPSPEMGVAWKMTPEHLTPEPRDGRCSESASLGRPQ